MTRYCPDCGDPHECTAQISGDDAKTKIRLAEIDAARDIRVAELAAGSAEVDAAAAVDIAGAEAIADAARAEGHADGVDRVLDDLAGAGAPPEGQDVGEPPPVLQLAEPEPEPEPVGAPPDMPHSPPPGKKNSGYWGNYS